MSTALPSLSLAPELPFKFVGGDPSLDFVNTVDWTRRGLVDDRLTGYARLLEWADAAAQLPATRVARLRSLAAQSPRAAQDAFAAALRGRWVLRQLFEAVIAGRRSPDALGEFNVVLRKAHRQLVLAWPKRGTSSAGTPLQWEWEEGDERLDAVLWPVVRAAAALLASEEVTQLRICGGPDCGWMYVDRSRNGLRRWCEMSVCGTREKSRRRAVRRQAER